MDSLCPYCLNKINKMNVQYVCPECGKIANPSMLERMAGKAPLCREKSCASRKIRAREKRCPHSGCGAALPSDILDYDRYLRFCMLGTTGSGKSTMLTVMLHELRNSGLPYVLSWMDDSTKAEFMANESSLYDPENPTPLPATEPGAPPIPLQWRLQDSSRMTRNTIPSYSLTIFDGAGEDHTKLDPKISRYIVGTETLVILIDPMVLGGIRRLVDTDILNWSRTATLGAQAETELVNGLVNYIKKNCDIPANRLIDKNVAVVFTKMDVVMSSFGQFTVTQPSPHVARRAFVKSDADAVDQEIRNWLSTNGEQGFLDAITISFPPGKVRFFGVSSYGNPPRAAGQLRTILPHRVLDPLMWMLAEEKIVPTVV